MKFVEILHRYRVPLSLTRRQTFKAGYIIAMQLYAAPLQKVFCDLWTNFFFDYQPFSLASIKEIWDKREG